MKMVGVLERLGVSGEKKLKTIGLILMALTGLLTTLANCLVQFISKRLRALNGLSLSSFEVLFIRSVIQLFFCLVYMVWLRVHPCGSKFSSLAPLLFMGLVEIGAIVCIYLALERIPIGDEAVIRVTLPVFAAIFSCVFFRRGCTIFESVSGLVSFLGVIIIAKPNWFGKLHSKNVQTVEFSQANINNSGQTIDTVAVFDSDKYYVGAAFAVSAAILLALFFVLNKMVGKRWDIVLTVFYPSLIGIVLAPFGMMMFGTRVLVSELDRETWGILCAIGLLCFVGLMFMAEAFQLEDPGPVALVRNLDAAFAFLIQYLLLSVAITWSSVVGGLIILVATSFLVGVRCLRRQSSPEHDANSLIDPDRGESEPLVRLSARATEGN